LYIPIFDKLLKAAEFGKEGRTYEKILQHSGVPEKYLFELSEIKSAIIIGKFPKPEELPQTLKKKTWQE